MDQQSINGGHFQPSSSSSPQFLSPEEPHRRKSIQKMEVFPLKEPLNLDHNDEQKKRDEIESDAV